MPRPNSWVQNEWHVAATATSSLEQPTCTRLPCIAAVAGLALLSSKHPAAGVMVSCSRRGCSTATTDLEVLLNSLHKGRLGHGADDGVHLLATLEDHHLRVCVGLVVEVSAASRIELAATR